MEVVLQLVDEVEDLIAWIALGWRSLIRAAAALAIVTALIVAVLLS